MPEIASGLYALPLPDAKCYVPEVSYPKCPALSDKRLGDQALFAFAVLALASISEQVYDVFAVMLLWGGQPLW